MDIEIRDLARGQVSEAVGMLFVAFGEMPHQRERELEERVLGEGRWVGAFEDDRIVGCSAYERLALTIPGSEVQMAAVTSVGVLPTHRRRGVLTELMRHQADELRDSDLAVAGLWASEAGIYGRYGYGLAVPVATFSIERPYTAFAREVAPAGRIRLIERDAVVPEFRPVYERVRARRPGFLERDDVWWDYVLEHHHGERDQPAYFALHQGPEGSDGFARYRIREKWSVDGPRSILHLDELVAENPSAYAALWRYLLDVDLVHTVRGENRPADEPLFHLLAEPRRLRLTLRDGLWIRLVDVPMALASRRYAAPGELVVEVRDGFGPWNEGRFELAGDRDGATCAETSRSPDLVCDASDLGAVFLGGVSMSALVRAGRVVEERDGAATRADAMFGWDESPWCPFVF